MRCVVYDAATNSYKAAVNRSAVLTLTKLGIERFTALRHTANDQPLRLYIGRPGLQQDVILFNFLIE